MCCLNRLDSTVFNLQRGSLHIKSVQIQIHGNQIQNPFCIKLLQCAYSLFPIFAIVRIDLSLRLSNSMFHSILQHIKLIHWTVAFIQNHLPNWYRIQIYDSSTQLSSWRLRIQGPSSVYGSHGILTKSYWSLNPNTKHWATDPLVYAVRTCR